MFDIQNYPSFLAAILIFQLVPGAGTIAILNATARNGVGAGLGAVLGTLTGDSVFMVAAAAGLAAIMHAHPLLFQALQWFGAAYLCLLGVQLLRPEASGGTLAAMMAHVTLLSLLYQAGLVFVGNAVARRLKALPAARRLATRLAGLALIGFGIKLAVDNR